MFAAEFGSGQVFWSVLWFSLFLLWIYLVVTIFADIIRARDQSGWGKAAWTIGIIILPLVGVFMYLIVNGDNMHRRDQDEALAYDAAMRTYIRNASGGSAADELSRLAELHESGALTDAEYDQAKARTAQ